MNNQFKMLKDQLHKIIGKGIARKFIFWTVAIIVLLDIMAANFMLADLDKTLSEELNTKGKFLANHLAVDINGTSSNGDIGKLTRLVEDIKNSDFNVNYVYITDARNNIIAHSYPIDFLPSGNDTSNKTGNTIEFIAPISGSSGSFVHVGMNRTSVNEKISKQTNLIFTNIIIEGILGFLMAYTAGIFLTRPIRALVQGVQEIGRGNLGYMIEPTSTDDEIETLSNAFNQMSYNLDKSMGELRKLSTAVEEAPDGIQITDLDGCTIYSNKAIEKILGYSPADFRGKNIREMNLYSEFADNKIIQDLKETGHWVGELMLRHKDGREVPIWLTTSIVRDDKGVPIAIVGIIRDITYQKEKEKLERQLLQADKLATIGQLASGVAHEINNPLGNISLYTQMLLRKTEDENTKAKLNVIADEANRAAQIVKGLLDFARQSEIELAPIDINKEIGKVLSILTPQLREIKVTKDFETLPSILGDSGQIEQVMMNLLTNAIQSITENGEIIIRTSIKHDHVEISISDNGCGIPGDILDKIFDPFFSTKEQGKGTGLGLSISYGIIKRHRGSIEVQSEVGKGTTFTIKLPA